MIYLLQKQIANHYITLQNDKLNMYGTLGMKKLIEAHITGFEHV